MSIEFYNRNSALFFAGSVDADMSASRARFLSYIPKNGAILDAGCGSGRDAKAFVEAGYAVSAFDGSAEMVRLASAHSGLSVLNLHFQDVAWTDAFDGVWACASLLHVARIDLPSVVARLVRALRPGGYLYMSFKYGDGERHQSDRHFTDMTEPQLTSLTNSCGLAVRDLWQSFDSRPERKEDRWISVIAKGS